MTRKQALAAAERYAREALAHRFQGEIPAKLLTAVTAKVAKAVPKRSRTKSSPA